jgi:two-component system, response regulator PdtaR
MCIEEPLRALEPERSEMRLVIALGESQDRCRLRAMLDLLGHRVVGEGADAEAAWRLARQHRPDLVVLEAVPGATESFEAGEAIRLALDVPLLFVSGAGDPSLLERARQVGCAGFLVQPFTAAGLGAALQIAMDRHAERLLLQRELAALKEKLEARKLIERAKAILMQQHGLTEPEAFRRLQRQSMATATPMKTLAEALIRASQT